MSIINRIKKRLKSSSYGWPFYYIDRFCALGGTRLVVTGVTKKYDVSSGIQEIENVLIQCPLCGEDDWEYLYPYRTHYSDEQFIIGHVTSWLNDDCPVLDSFDIS